MNPTIHSSTGHVGTQTTLKYLKVYQNIIYKIIFIVTSVTDQNDLNHSRNSMYHLI
jgi:hypothetical protein